MRETEIVPYNRHSRRIKDGIRLRDEEIVLQREIKFREEYRSACIELVGKFGQLFLLELEKYSKENTKITVPLILEFLVLHRRKFRVIPHIYKYLQYYIRNASAFDYDYEVDDNKREFETILSLALQNASLGAETHKIFVICIAMLIGNS